MRLKELKSLKSLKNPGVRHIRAGADSSRGLRGALLVLRANQRLDPCIAENELNRGWRTVHSTLQLAL